MTRQVWQARSKVDQAHTTCRFSAVLHAVHPSWTPTFLTWLAVCSSLHCITHCTYIKKSRIQNTKRDHMNVKQEVNSPKSCNTGSNWLVLTTHDSMQLEWTSVKVFIILWMTQMLSISEYNSLQIYTVIYSHESIPIHHRIHILWSHPSTRSSKLQILKHHLACRFYYVETPLFARETEENDYLTFLH